MALDNYDNLKAAIEDYSHRNDIKNKIDDFLLIAEQEMYSNTIEPLRIREMEQTASTDTTTSSRYIALPSGFEQMRSIKIDDKSADAPSYDLCQVTPTVMVIETSAGMPSSFVVTSQIEFNRTPDAVYNVDIIYHGSLTPLSDTNSTNAVLTSYPSIYLYGALWALYQWSMQLDLSDYYYNKFMLSIRGANNSNELGNYGPAPFVSFDGAIV